MSSERWVISTLIVLHLVGITTASLPDPRELELVRLAGTERSPADLIGRTLTPALDATVSALAPLEAEAFRLTVPIRGLTRTYIQAGLRQKWNMFANPVTADQYARVALYVSSSGERGRVRVSREVVLPGQREDRHRLVHTFRDKAVLNSLEAFSINRLEHPEAAHSDLAPVAAYFGDRIAATYLAPGERVLRTEVWFGQALMPPTGHRVSESQLTERWAVLQRYRDAPVDVPDSATALEPGALQSESDIAWRLEYVQSR